MKINSSYNFLVAFLFLASSWTIVLSKTLEECGGQGLSSEPTINAFFPIGSVDEACANFTKTFECLDDSESKLSDQVLYNSQRLVIDYICRHREEYKKSQSCFLAEGLKELMKYKCLRKTDIFHCWACEQVSQCVEKQVMSRRGEGCRTTDAVLMVSYARLFFQPIREAKNCNGPASENYCPPPEPKTTSMTTFTPKTSTETEQNIDDGGSASTKTKRQERTKTKPPTSHVSSAGTSTRDSDNNNNRNSGNRFCTVNCLVVWAITLSACFYCGRHLTFYHAALE